MKVQKPNTSFQTTGKVYFPVRHRHCGLGSLSERVHFSPVFCKTVCGSCQIFCLLVYSTLCTASVSSLVWLISWKCSFLWKLRLLEGECNWCCDLCEVLRLSTDKILWKICNLYKNEIGILVEQEGLHQQDGQIYTKSLKPDLAGEGGTGLSNREEQGIAEVLETNWETSVKCLIGIRVFSSRKMTQLIAKL